MAIWKTLRRLLSRSFQEARELLARAKSAGGYIPVVGIGAF